MWKYLVVFCVACGTRPAVTVDATPSSILNENETLSVASWNLSWFGSKVRGPDDEVLQWTNVQGAIAGLAPDIFGLVEVVSADDFQSLLASLPEHSGVIATDVEQGTHYYSTFEQKPALIVGPRVQIESARLILTASAKSFAGRPPLEVTLRLGERRLVVIVVHLKAMSDVQSYAHRVAAAAALEAYLDESALDWTAVIGDFNDDIDTSMTKGKPSPFEALAVDYRFATQALSDSQTSTTTHFSTTIDHHLVTQPLFSRLMSAEIVRLDQDIESYSATTSDHYPVLTRYDLR